MKGKKRFVQPFVTAIILVAFVFLTIPYADGNNDIGTSTTTIGGGRINEEATETAGIYTTSEITNATIQVTLYEFDGDFTSANDSAYDGIASPGVTFVTGQDGQAASFDGGIAVGTNNPDVDHVDSIMTTPASDFNAGFSIMGWVNYNDQGTVILGHDQSCCGFSFLGFKLDIVPGGVIILLMRDSSDGRLMGLTNPGTVTPGLWSHIAATWDGNPLGGITIYLNGEEMITNLTFIGGVFSGLDGTGELPVRIGANFANMTGNINGLGGGSIDHISFWEEVLSAEEILADFQATSFVELSFDTTEAQLKFLDNPNNDQFNIKGEFVLDEGNNGIDPTVEDVIVNVGTSSIVIPAPDAFVEYKAGVFKYKGMINSTDVEMEIKAKDIDTFYFEIKVKGADIIGTANPVEVELTIGDDKGNTNIILEGVLNSKKNVK